MFFRGRQPEASIWRRFRTSSDGFSFTKEEDYYAAHVVANAERVVDLFHTLLEQMPPAVDVVVIDARSKRQWKGERLPLPDVREAVARLKAPLAAFGGVEIAVFTGEDQITLNPVLELFIYARTDRWLYILQGKGLHEVSSFGPESWRFDPQALGASPELSDAIVGAAERLGLEPA